MAGMRGRAKAGVAAAALGAALGAAATTARAQDVLVSKGVAQKSALDLSGFSAAGAAGGEVAQTLKADLARSGWFAVVGAGRGEFRVAGTAADAGGRVEAQAALYRAATGQALLSKSYRGTAAEARRVAHAIADDIVRAATGRRGFASARLALVGNRTRHKEVYLCDSDGRGLVQLTQDRSISLYPRWSPDGRRLTYTSYLKGFPDVYLVELAGGGRQRISSFPGLNAGAAWSPDGRSLALVLSKDGNPELYVRPVAGGDPTRITRTPRASESSPSWSPDGQRVVFVSDASGSPQLYLASRQGGAPQRITGRGLENVAPDWGPGGLIAFSSRQGGRYQLCVLDPATMEVKQLALDGADYEDPSWAPDGRHLACVRTVAYRPAIYLVDTLGDEPVCLLSEGGSWFSPSWSR